MTPLELKILRKQYCLTQAELGARLAPPVSRLTIYNWESGKFAIPVDIAHRLQAADLVTPPAAPKETPKQQRDRLAAEAKEVQFAVERYRSLRAWPDIPNHNAAMRFYARNKQPGPPPIAHAAILAAFPDIITDPDGDHTMTKEQSQAIILETGKN